MALDFLESKYYLKLFPLQKLSGEMTKKAYDLFWNNRELLELASREDDVKVISIGFNMGARDVAVVVGLAKALASSQVDQKTRLPEIHVLAIDPATVKPNIASCRDFLEKAGFFREDSPCDSSEIPFGDSPEIPSDDIPEIPTKDCSEIPFGDTHETWLCNGSRDQAGIKVEIVGQTAEAWIESQVKESVRQWDVVLACAVLHLLTDWKTTLDFFLRNLTTNGIFMFVEATGNVGAFEGDFRSGVPADDTWSKLWHAMTEVRADLLLPSSKVVSPGDMSFLASTLESINYTKLYISEEEPCIDVTTVETLQIDEIRQLIKTVEEGPDAKTLGAFRIYDRDRAQHFVAKALEKLSELQLSDSEPITFNTGTKIHAYRKLEPARRDCCLSEAVAHSAWACAQAEVLERKSSIKQALGSESGGGSVASKTTRTSEAIATLLFDMREALALSRDTLLVLARRRGHEYTEAFQLPPLSLIGEESSASVEIYLATMSAYVDFNKTKHFSELLNISNIGDLTVCIDTRPHGNENRCLSLSVHYTADGSPSFLQLNVPENIFLECRSKLVEFPAFSGSEGQRIGKKYEGWDPNYGFTRFFVEPFIKDSSDANEEAESTIAHIIKCSKIEEKVKEALKNKCSQWTEKQRESITNVLSYTLRLAWIEWRNSNHESPCWKTCYYFVRKHTHVNKAEMSVGLLLLVSAEDQKAWEAFSTKIAENRSSKLPVLISAIEPFLSAIQEIRSPEISAELMGEDIADSFGHELACIFAGAARGLNSLEKQADISSSSENCRFATQLAKSALLYGLCWGGSSDRSLMSKNSLPFNFNLQGISWKCYVEVVAKESWRIFIGANLINMDTDYVFNQKKVEEINKLLEAKIETLLIIEPNESIFGCNDKVNINNRILLGNALFGWFLVAITNAWKNIIFPKKINNIIDRIEMVKNFLYINSSNITFFSGRYGETSFFEIQNAYHGADFNPCQKIPLKGTSLALDEATKKIKTSLGFDDSIVHFQFYGFNEKWITKLIFNNSAIYIKDIKG